MPVLMGSSVHPISRLYSSILQHERKNGQSLHLLASFLSMRYCFPAMPFISFSIIPAIQGGVCDLQPCLLSQLMQYPCFGLIGISIGPISLIRPIFCLSPHASRFTPNGCFILSSLPGFSSFQLWERPLRKPFVCRRPFVPETLLF